MQTTRLIRQMHLLTLLRRNLAASLLSARAWMQEGRRGKGMKVLCLCAGLRADLERVTAWVRAALTRLVLPA